VRRIEGVSLVVSRWSLGGPQRLKPLVTKLVIAALKRCATQKHANLGHQPGRSTTQKQLLVIGYGRGISTLPAALRKAQISAAAIGIPIKVIGGEFPVATWKMANTELAT